MKIEIQCQPAASVARLGLDVGETVTCEVGAMIAMSSGLRVETAARKRGAKKGVLAGVKRLFAGESFFLNHFTANEPDQVLVIGPSLLGDIVHHRLSGGSLIVQGSSWMASSEGIEIDATFQGLGRALLSGEGMFWIKCSGDGDLLLNSFGAIYEIDVRGGYIVDTGHIVAFEDSLQFDITKAGSSWIGSFMSGEGLVCKFKGSGKLYCQSHNPPTFGKLLGPRLRPR